MPQGLQVCNLQTEQLDFDDSHTMQPLNPFSRRVLMKHGCRVGIAAGLTFLVMSPAPCSLRHRSTHCAQAEARVFKPAGATPAIVRFLDTSCFGYFEIEE